MELRAGGLTARVVADEFLRVESLVHDGRELLVGPGELPHAARVHGRWAGITFLHPWANRLGADAYAVAGVTASLDGGPEISRDAAGLALHGLPGRWHLTRTSRSSASADLVHGGALAFPFRHSITVELGLGRDTLCVRTTLRAANDGGPVPVAFGWHPYLRPARAARADWLLSLPAREAAHLDAHGLPAAGPDRALLPAECAPLARRHLDEGYEGIAPGAVLAVDDLRVVLQEGYPVAQVFAPAGTDVVSLEPMTAPTNALVSGRGLRLVAPGEEFCARFTLEAG